MKKVMKYASLFLAAGAIVMSCKNSDNPAPDTSNPATGDAVCIGGNKTYVLIDASTSAGAASYTKSFACDVKYSSTSKTDTIYLDIKAQKDMDLIYITKSVDNGNSVALNTGLSNLTTDNGGTVTAGSSNYSYALPTGGVTGITAFKLKIPVNLNASAAAVSDVYTIWITNGKGNFSATGKNTVVGPISVALNYTTNTPYITANSITIGDQNNDSPSYLVTTGVIGVIYGDSLTNSNPPLTTEQLTQSLNSVDINLVRLNAAGTTRDLAFAGSPYFIGVGLRNSLSFTVNKDGTIITKFALYTGTTSFSLLTGNDIASLPSPTADRILIAEGKAYVFLTHDGRKGVIAVNSLTPTIAATSTGFGANVSLKVLTK